MEQRLARDIHRHGYCDDEDPMRAAE